MRVVVVYQDNHDYTRSVDEFMRDFRVRTGHDLEVVNPDSALGSQFCDTYDIVQYPTVIALGNDGTMQNVWSGTQLPTINEVSYYVQTN